MNVEIYYTDPNYTFVNVYLKSGFRTVWSGTVNITGSSRFLQDPNELAIRHKLTIDKAVKRHLRSEHDRIQKLYLALKDATR